MKKRLALLLVMGMVAASLAGCGNAAKTDETVTLETAETVAAETTESVGTEAAETPVSGGGSNIIYVITASYATPLFETEANTATAKAEELGYEVKAVSHDDDLTKQSQIIETAIADKAAGIILDNAGAEGSVEAVKAAKAAGIPTAIIDRELASEGDAIAQFVSNNYQGAQIVAEIFVEQMGEEGEYAELLGKETETACTVRSQGFHDVIDQYDGLEMVAQETANWEQTTAYDKMETMLQAHPDIKGVICGNDPMALGAAAACKAMGKEGVVIVSVDGSNEARDAILDGSMTATALQMGTDMAERAVEAIDTYLKTGSTGLDAEKQLVDCRAIDASNAQYLDNFVYSEE